VRANRQPDSRGDLFLAWVAVIAARTFGREPKATRWVADRGMIGVIDGLRPPYRRIICVKQFGSFSARVSVKEGVREERLLKTNWSARMKYQPTGCAVAATTELSSARLQPLMLGGTTNTAV